MMKFVDSTQIDKKRWDEIIAKSAKNNVTCYSWYLDATTKKWGAIIEEDYSFLLPLPYKNRILFESIFQHPFSRNLEFFGNAEKLEEAESLLEKMGHFHFHFPHKLRFESTERIFQKLKLNQEIAYKKNTVRILKKYAADYEFKISTNYAAVAQFYFENSFDKIKQQKANKVFLEQLFQAAITNGKGEVIEAYTKSGELVGAAFYLKDKETVYYLIGDSSTSYKKKGIMFCIMDFAIQHYQAEFKEFDFGGSNVPSVATFYHKMGGQDYSYFEYKK